MHLLSGTGQTQADPIPRGHAAPHDAQRVPREPKTPKRIGLGLYVCIMQIHIYIYIYI